MCKAIQTHKHEKHEVYFIYIYKMVEDIQYVTI